MTYRFHPRAEVELEEVADYYEGCQPGLGYEFVEEVYACVGRILDFPEAWPRLSERTRRCQLHRFPYGIVYEIRKGYVLIVALGSLHRGPEYWEEALKR